MTYVGMSASVLENGGSLRLEHRELKLSLMRRHLVECEPCFRSQVPVGNPGLGTMSQVPSQGPFKLLPVMLGYYSPSRFVERVSNDNVYTRTDFMETTELQKTSDLRELNSTISLRSF